MTEDAKEIGERIKRLREARGWSQRALGTRAGLSGAYVAMVEGGKYKPKHDKIVKLAYALGVQEHEITGSADGLRRSDGNGEGEIDVYSLPIPQEEIALVRTVLTNVALLAQQIDDMPALLKMWAALPAGTATMIADMISLSYARHHLNNKSGKVHQAVRPRQRIAISSEPAEPPTEGKPNVFIAGTITELERLPLSIDETMPPVRLPAVPPPRERP